MESETTKSRGKAFQAGKNSRHRRPVMMGSLTQQSQTFLAPGTGFVEDNFSLGVGENGFRVIQAHQIYCALYFYYHYIVIYN